MKLVIGITGASGVQYGIRLAEVLRGRAETFLIITRTARQIIKIESETEIHAVEELATHTPDEYDFTSPVASGSYLFDGMVVVPCSMRTLGSIANGIPDNLITRTADVCLKEGRKLILVPRETPLSLIHIENLLRAKTAGATILPASPGFYTKPASVSDLIDVIVGRILDALAIEHELCERWG
ncbi:MAG: UbiX family flavin prenyltransferase [Methanosarcinales archaeon]|nr:UbiX family flavin prenyltransferase [Methanosarcinales archaeon]HDJ38495.1 UbiX family flavin prenyltransferase [Methanosarcinales archaeon]